MQTLRVNKAYSFCSLNAMFDDRRSWTQTTYLCFEGRAHSIGEVASRLAKEVHGIVTCRWPKIMHSETEIEQLKKACLTLLFYILLFYSGSFWSFWLALWRAEWVCNPLFLSECYSSLTLLNFDGDGYVDAICKQSFGILCRPWTRWFLIKLGILVPAVKVLYTWLYTRRREESGRATGVLWTRVVIRVIVIHRCCTCVCRQEGGWRSEEHVGPAALEPRELSELAPSLRAPLRP